MAKIQTVLVTGGAGFIGSHLTEKLLSEKYKVIVFDNFQTGKINNLKKCFKHKNIMVIQADINSRSDIRQLLKFDLDYIFHYAAVVGVQRTLQQPLQVLDDLDGIKNILDLAREKHVKRVFYSSSSEVYGESVNFPQSEKSTPLNSKLPYAAVKNLGEIFIRTYFQEYGLKYTIFRFFNTYGPRQSAEFVMSKFIKQALNSEPLTVYGTGNQSRSFIYIRDNINTVFSALTAGSSINATINIGNPEEIDMKHLAALIIKKTGSKSRLFYKPALPEGDMPRRVPDISLMKSLLHNQPAVTLDQGLLSTIKYVKDEYISKK